MVVIKKKENASNMKNIAKAVENVASCHHHCHEHCHEH